MELAGCYRVVLTVQVICEQHGIKAGQIELECDNIEALCQDISLEDFISQVRLTMI